MNDGLVELLERSSVCVCAGPGGVGKTTTAAALAAGMAARGRRVGVLTIDPAKRLADSLGLEALGNEERRVPRERFERAGIDPGEGELWAMMLDVKATFDGVVAAHAPDEESRRRLLENRIYREISGTLAGSQELMAMERLHELHERGDYDLLVLDTPPSRNALDFLAAPSRLRRLFEARSLRPLIRPTGIGARLAGRGLSGAGAVLRRLTGIDLIRDLADFFAASAGLVDGFSARARRVEELLSSASTTFLIVSGPGDEQVEEALHLRARLAEGELPYGGMIVNRAQVADGTSTGPDVLAAELEAALGDADLAALVLATHADRAALVERDRQAVARLRAAAGGPEPIVVPELADEVHDFEGLLALGPYLLGEPG